MQYTLVCTTLVLGAALTGPAGGATAHSDRAFRLGAGATVRVEATAGDVQVIGSLRPDVRVRIERRSSGGVSLSTLQERVDADGTGLRVSVRQAGDGRDARLTSTVVVDMPRSQALAMVDLFEGTVRVRGVGAGASVRLTRGNIEAVDVSGPLRFETTMGSIRVVHAAAPLAAAIRVRTFNGNIDVTLPGARPQARILALTLNGAIESTLPLTTRTTVGPRFSEATFGNGTPVINLDAVNGDIRLASAER